MNDSEQQFSLLDILTIISFIIGVANYSENVDQSQIQDIVKSAVLDVHNHLKDQDEKLSKIIAMLEGKK